MAIDLTVAAVPFYFGSMEVERRALQARGPSRVAPSPADYTREDTQASLAMGVASLSCRWPATCSPRHVVPGKGRFGKALVGTAAAAAVVTTVADRLAGADADDPDDPRDQRRRRPRPRAGHARPLAAPLGPQGATGRRTGRRSPRRCWPRPPWITSRTNAWRMWEKGQRHDLGDGPLAWGVAIAGWDFIYYWNHRFMHEVRAAVGASTWCTTPASATTSPPRCGSRSPTSSACSCPTGSWPASACGPRLIAQARGINLLYQYWIHTDTIRSLGAGEEVLNTPSHHRVHHGSNGKYLDRNHGSILIVWDRLFGTFQREEEPVVYGLTKNIDTYNPLRIASHEHVDIVPRRRRAPPPGAIGCPSSCAAPAGPTAATPSEPPPASADEICVRSAPPSGAGGTQKSGSQRSGKTRRTLVQR